MGQKISRVGFTLIELLIVIAIVCILAAILMPVFAQVREKARRTTCLSHENQIGIAFLQYTQDNDERFPNGINPAGGPFWAGEGWAGQCLSYFHSAALLHCPDDHTQSLTSHDTAISYGYNINLVEPGEDAEYAPFGYTAGASPPGHCLAALNAPARTVCSSRSPGSLPPSLNPGREDRNLLRPLLFCLRQRLGPSPVYPQRRSDRS